MTGTPVQNSLDDLGGLLRFLNLDPFCNRKSFARYIMQPLRNEEQIGLSTLQHIIRSICLRRTKETIKLPMRECIILNIALSREERALYDENVANAILFLDKALDPVYHVDRSYSNALQLILRLRLICNHGSDLLRDRNEAWMRNLSLEDAQVDKIAQDSLQPRNVGSITDLHGAWRSSMRATDFNTNNYRGPSSKVRALIQTIEENKVTEDGDLLKR